MNQPGIDRSSSALSRSYYLTRIDYSALMGPRFPLVTETKPAEWPMYSYERPAWLYFNGVANFLRQQGLTNDEIKARLAHKDMRWMLDSRDSVIELMGYEHAKEYFGSSFSSDTGAKP